MNAVNQLYQDNVAATGRQRNRTSHASNFRSEALQCVMEKYNYTAETGQSLRAQTDNSSNVNRGFNQRTVVRNCVNEALADNVSSTRAERESENLLEDIYLEAWKHRDREETPNLSTSQSRPTQHVESVTDQSLVTEVT